MRQSPALTPALGQTCDGLPPHHRAASNALLGTAQYGGDWTFNLKSWRWERKGGAIVGGTAAAAAEGASDKHALAARRWGDGRDGLASAVKRARLDGVAEDEGTAAVVSPSLREVGGRLSLHPDRWLLGLCDSFCSYPCLLVCIKKSSGRDLNYALLVCQVTGAEPRPAASTGRGASSPGTAGFSSIGGLHKQKEALRRAVVVPLRHPGLLRALGARPGRGALLHGPPGSGKTLLAAALAAEAGVHLEVCSHLTMSCRCVRGAIGASDQHCSM